LLAAGLDIVLGTAIAYLIFRSQLPARQWLDYLASISLAIPGLVLAIGYLRVFRGVDIPFTDTPVVATWVLIMIAYAIRRLPYALRSCMAALQQIHISLEEASNSLGGNKISTIRRIMIPLMAGGILAGFVTSFITAAVELSATILLTSAQSQAPMSYGIYLYMQSIAGRGPGAALGVIAVIVVAIGTYLSHRVIERSREGARMTNVQGH
jgi:iron(III) transport system permease protein